ncbi:MAG TPA: GNAT family N-acetyltransferase [Pyrinomonadaceae bacterium]|nr:GNAT family N-acetyltransferase [Pyrinomonadaceae bacterium]
MEIRKIESLAEMREVERLQREIWGVDDLEVYPALALKPQTEVGGILIGAFDEGRMVGFVFGFPGILDGETIIHSDMLGISEGYRSHNLGYALKLAQREAALQRGIERITWTFDPLQSRNAHFNFSKLGVISDRYYVDYYGVTSSFLHRFGTDRLWVTWLLNSERVNSRIEGMKPTAPGDVEQLLHLVRVGDNVEPISDEFRNESQLLIEIPTEITTNHERWRETTRKAFTTAIGAAYVVEGFHVNETRQVGSYLLRQDLQV